MARRVFVSYRRGETRHLAGRLSDRLADRFGTDRVFVDVDSIPPGVDFAEEIERQLGDCAVLLAIIGRDWVAAVDARGRRRLDDPDDFVALEIRTALARGVRVIPVLVDGAAMPGRGELPTELAAFARRNAVRLDHDTFRSDVGALLTQLDGILNEPEPHPPAPPPSRPMIANRYEVGELLGASGISEVYRGRDVRLSLDVAIRLLSRPELSGDTTARWRFRHMAQPIHPSIVRVYDAGEADLDGGSRRYIISEFVDGHSLRDLLGSSGKLDTKFAVNTMADVCAAVEFAHRHHLLHLDLKPANVMITSAGVVKVTGFDLWQATADSTAEYLAPERARGEPADARSDVYSAGCVLYELITGRPPFIADTPIAVAYYHAREELPPMSSLVRGVSSAAQSIVDKAMAKNSADRYQSAGAMRADLLKVFY